MIVKGVLGALGAGKPIILPRDGDTAVQFIHEDDLGAAVCWLVDQNRKERAVFNIVDRQILSLMVPVSRLPVSGRTFAAVRDGLGASL